MTVAMNDDFPKETPLAQLHREFGAKMIPFAGWLMPVQYEGIMNEHRAVRSAAGLFDVSHMGEIAFRGPDAMANIQKLVSNNVEKLGDGEALYSGLLYPTGTFVDDLLVYRFSADHFWMVVNASNVNKDFAWVIENVKGDVHVENISDTVCQIALQGPKAMTFFHKVTNINVEKLGPFTFIETDILGQRGMISRTGYTGEDGLELYVPWNHGPTVWSFLLDEGKSIGLKPIGLGARDTLRLEAGLPLYGNDISDKTTPIEARLKWTVKFKKGDFIGRDVLVKQKDEGVTRLLTGFIMKDKGIPRQHYPILHSGTPVGEVASGGVGVWLDQRIGTAYLPLELSDPGQSIEIDIRNRISEAVTVPLPFYRRPQGAASK